MSRREWCRHVTGVQHNTCKAGVAYETVRAAGAAAFRTLPCLHADSPVTCPHRAVLSEEEAAAEERETEAAIARIGVIRKAIKATKLGSGTIPCPSCVTGKVRFTVSSYNGHVHAACSTPRCASWME